MIKSKDGFVIIIVVAFLAILLLISWAVVNIGCGEILQTRSRNDYVSAHYVAVSGAELLYNRLKSLEGTTVTWPQTIPSQDSYVKTNPPGGITIGAFSASANTITANEFGIVSEGIVNGHKERLVVKYGFSSPFTNGAPLGSIGPMTLTGRGFLGFKSWVRAEGPLESNSTVTTNNYVKVNGEIMQNQSFIPPSFWLGTRYDTNNDGVYVTDTNGDGHVTIADCGEDQAKIEAFNADNTYSGDGEINDKDAFYYYYTSYLNAQGGYNIGPGQANYYSGTQTFGPGDVPQGRTIIFVDGDVNIAYNDQNWSGGAMDHTIIATGDITIVQPTNGSDDRLTLVAYDDVATGGIRAFGGIRGNIVIYAHDDFYAYYGGRTNGTIFAEGELIVDTVFPIPGLLNRDLNRGSDNWGDPENQPVGLPPGFMTVSLSFRIQDETVEYKPVWRRN